MNIKYTFILLCCSFFLTRCNIINPPEKVPTYIHIDSFLFKNSGNVSFGSNSHKITTVWAYYNGSTVGAFDLPATFPVIATGTGEMRFAPGISIDGLQDYQGAYDFYTLDSFKLTASPGKVINYNPTTQYVTQNISFPYIENFDITNTFTFLSGVDSIRRTISHDSVFEGSGSGRVHLTHLGDSSECIALTSFSVANGHGAFIELNYKSSMPLSIGIRPEVSGIGFNPYYIVSFYPNANWTKVYINLIDILSLYNGYNYKVCIKTALPVSQGQSDGYILIDNVKVVSN